MGSLRFGTSFTGLTHDRYVHLARQAEAAGFNLIGIGDSQSAYLDCYSVLTLMAEHTSTVLLGPMVTNPVLRHPAVTAGAVSSLQELSEGRAFLGLSGGASSVAAVGESSGTLRQTADYGRAVRTLTSGQPTVWRGKQMHVSWADQRVPLYLAPGGPKGLRQAGAIADGVFLNTGNTTQTVESALAQIGLGAHDAGRNPSEIDVWLSIRGFLVTDDRASGIRSLLHMLVHTIVHSFGSNLDGKLVPPELHDRIRALLHDYRADIDNTPEGARANANLLDQHGLRDWAVERFAIVGPPDYCRDRLARFADLGIDAFVLPARGDDLIRALAEVGEQIVAPMRATDRTGTA